MNILKQLSVAMLTLFTSTIGYCAQSCIKDYQNEISAVNDKILLGTSKEEEVESKVQLSENVGIALGITTYALSFGSAAHPIATAAYLTTGGGLGLAVGNVTGKLIFNYESYNLDDLRLLKYDLLSTLSHLRDARKGHGRSLIITLNNILEESDISISESQLAEVISSLDESRAFCENGLLSSDAVYEMILDRILG